MQQLVAASHTVCLHVEGPNNLGGCWGPTPTDGGVLDALESRNTLLPHMYYHAKFCCSRSNLVSEMTYNVLMETLNPIHSLTHSLTRSNHLGEFSHARSNTYGVPKHFGDVRGPTPWG